MFGHIALLCVALCVFVFVFVLEYDCTLQYRSYSIAIMFTETFVPRVEFGQLQLRAYN